MQVARTYTLDLELVKKLDKVKNKSEFIQEACFEKFNSTRTANKISNMGKDGVRKKSLRLNN